MQAATATGRRRAVSPLRRPTAVVAVLTGVLGALLVGLAPPAPAAAAATYVSGVRLNGHEAALVSYVNAARRASGLVPLTVATGTTDVSRRWSYVLAYRQELSHNPAMVSQVSAAGGKGWGQMAENVGYASACDPKQLFDAYMGSPGHRANILDPEMRFLGIGTVQRARSGWSCGVAWNTMNFVDRYSALYGPTREPAHGMRSDARAVGAATLADLEQLRDARVGMTAVGSGIATTALGWDGVTSRDDAMRMHVRSTGTGTGDGILYYRDALDLRSSRALTFTLGRWTPSGAALPVDVWTFDLYGRSSYLGRVVVGSPRAVTLALPTAARSFTTTVQLRVRAADVRALGSTASAQQAQLHLYRLGTA